MNKIVKEFLDKSSNYEVIEYIGQLQQQNKKIKKQLEESKDNYNCLLKQKEQFEYIMSKQVDYRGQQKEFLNYLENEIDICDSFLDTVKSDSQEIPYGVISAGKTYITTRIKENETAHKVYEEILQKYREIIEVSDEKK